MKRIWVSVMFVLLCLPANLFGQGLLPGGFPSLSSLTDNVKVNPYAQVGFQWVGAHLDLPVQNEQPVPLPGALEISELDVSLKDANFWAGTVGINIIANEKYSLFGTAGRFLDPSVHHFGDCAGGV